MSERWQKHIKKYPYLVIYDNHSCGDSVNREQLSKIDPKTINYIRDRVNKVYIEISEIEAKQEQISD